MIGRRQKCKTYQVREYAQKKVQFPHLRFKGAIVYNSPNSSILLILNGVA
jgi:hypothetical protein